MKASKFSGKLTPVIAFTFPVLLVVGVLTVLIGASHMSFVFSLILPVLVIFNLLQIFLLLLKRSKKVIAHLFALLVFFSFFDGFYQFNVKVEPIANSIKIVSFNTYQFKTSSRGIDNGEQKIISFIKETKPDIICFQEFSAIKYKLFSKEYPHWVKTNIMVPHKSVMSVFSKYPIVNKGFIEFSNSINNTMFVDVEIQGEVLRFYNVHLESYKTNTMYQLNEPNGFRTLIKQVFEADKIRAHQARLVKTHADGFNGKTIIVGDFNST